MQDFDAYYHVEHHLIPAQMKRFWEEDCRLSVLYNKNEWRGILTRLFTYDGFDWRNLRTRAYVNANEPPVVVLYLFPIPFRAPLAKYGAIVLNNHRLKYYTLELGFDGQYVLGYQSETGTRFSLGPSPDLTPDEFLQKICSLEEITLPEEMHLPLRKRLWRIMKTLI